MLQWIIHIPYKHGVLIMDLHHNMMSLAKTTNTEMRLGNRGTDMDMKLNDIMNLMVKEPVWTWGSE